MLSIRKRISCTFPADQQAVHVTQQAQFRVNRTGDALGDSECRTCSVARRQIDKDSILIADESLHFQIPAA